jgi:hypothetical protein
MKTPKKGNNIFTTELITVSVLKRNYTYERGSWEAEMNMGYLTKVKIGLNEVCGFGKQ